MSNNTGLVPRAMHVLSEEVQSDRTQGSYAYSWWCNLVMPVIDAGGTREVAEIAASTIMFNAFGFRVPEDWRSTP